MRKFDLSLRSSRSSYFATFRHQLTILSKTDALDEEKWLNMLGTFVKDWFRYESHFVRSLIMFQSFISRHNSNFFSDKLVLTSVTPASSAPVLQTPKATSSTLYFDSLTVNAGNGGFLHCIQMDTSVNAANQVVSVGADI